MQHLARQISHNNGMAPYQRANIQAPVPANINGKHAIFGAPPAITFRVDFSKDRDVFGSQRLAGQGQAAGLTHAGLSTLPAVSLPAAAAAQGMLGTKIMAANSAGGDVSRT